MLNNYCSRLCWIKHCCGKYLRTGETLKCPTCRKDFYTRGANIRRGARFCSWKCFWASKGKWRKRRRCKVCGKWYSPSGKRQKYCSQKCSKMGPLNPLWRGGVKARSCGDARYQKWRKDVLKRDKYTCQHCGASAVKLQVHHIHQYRTRPDLRCELSNGQTLCFPCHIKTPSFGIRGVRTLMEFMTGVNPGNFIEYRKPKTHCKNGHEFNLGNTRTYSFKGQTQRVCRVCDRKRKNQTKGQP